MKNDVTIELVSHPLCPFTQACRIALARGGWEDGSYTMTYVDLAALPDWFAVASPDNDMPVIRMDGEVRGYDARAFVEWVAESSGTMRSADPVVRMQQREWSRKADKALDTLKDVFVATTTDALESAIVAVGAILAPMERALATGTSAIGTRDFSIADAAIAPFFSLALFYPELRQRLERVAPLAVAYGTRLIGDSQVDASRCNDYDGEFSHFFAIFGSVFPEWRSV